MWRGIVLLGFTLVCGWGQTPPAGAAYVDPALCAECHGAIARKYALTGMARSFHSVGAGSVLPEFTGRSFDHSASEERFTPVERDGQYFFRRYQTGPDGRDVNSLELRVDYVMGSGDHSRSYLHRTPDNKLTEFPVSWYSENGGHLGMSPGYDRPGHAGFSREVPYRCMFCHNGYPQIDGYADRWDRATAYPVRLPEGIDCQRCHGPGGNHVETAKGGAALAAVRASIVNPARLNAERRLEVCFQCHLETTSGPLPGALMRFDRGTFSYRPGEPLGDYMLYFDHAPGTGHDDKFEIVSSAYRLRKSACFQAGNGKLECTSCHDPHQAASRRETLQRTGEVCRNCHGEAVAKLVREGRHPADGQCGTCHMPQRPTEDAIHVLITDHWIGAPSPSNGAPLRPMEQNRETPPYSGEVRLYYPREMPSTAESALYLAIAQVKDLSNLPEGFRRLEDALTRYRPQSARPYFETGQAFLAAGQAVRAIPFLDEAVKREPREWRYPYSLAQAWLVAQDPTQAARLYERARTLAPEQPPILYGLGEARSALGDLTAAAAAFRQASIRDPESADGPAKLGNVLVRLRDVGAAERALREAVRLRPEVADVRINLAAALIQGGKLPEARQEIEEAIRAGPATEVARSAWFAALGANASVPEARARYDESLHSQLSGAHANLGTVLALLGQGEASIREFRLAVAGDPASAVARLNLALGLRAGGESAEARQQLEQALRIAPGLFEGHLALGEILLAAGEREGAAAHLRRAAESRDARVSGAAQRLLGGALTGQLAPTRSARFRSVPQNSVGTTGAGAQQRVLLRIGGSRRGILAVHQHGIADADLVSGLQAMLRDSQAVDVGSHPGAAIVDLVPAVAHPHGAVFPRRLTFREPNIGRRRPADPDIAARKRKPLAQKGSTDDDELRIHIPIRQCSKCAERWVNRSVHRP